MRFVNVITNRAVPPTGREALLRPQIVCVLRQCFDEAKQRGRQPDPGGVDRDRVVLFPLAHFGHPLGYAPPHFPRYIGNRSFSGHPVTFGPAAPNAPSNALDSGWKPGVMSMLNTTAQQTFSEP